MANTSKVLEGGSTHAGTVYVGATTDKVLFRGTLKETASALAATGNNQATAAAITGPLTQVTAADGTKGVVLPAAVAGLRYVLYNAAASALKVYPASGDDINDGTADASISVPAKTAAEFIALDTSTWQASYATDWCTQNVMLADTVDITVGSTTGTKLATGASQKLAFWNAAPAVQQTAGTDVTATTAGANVTASGAGLSLIGDTSGGDVSAAIMADFKAIQEDVAALAVLLNQINTDLKSIGITVAP